MIKKEKLGQRGREGVTWPTFGILGPLHNSARFELETSNLACRLTTKGTNEKKWKTRSKTVGKGPRDILLKFRDPSLSRERYNLATSNSACRLATRGTNDKNEKNRSKGSGRNHVTYFFKFWDALHISGTVWARNFNYGMQIDHQGSLMIKINN